MHPYAILKETPIRAAVLGSTGSVGIQTLDVMKQLHCRVVLLSAGRNVELAAEQAREFRPYVCTMETEEAASALKLALAGENIRVYGGKDAVCKAVRECEADVILHSIAGLAGLPSALAAVETGTRVGIANKEAIIAAGDRIFNILRKSGGEMIPVDSEHSAIFQCLVSSGKKTEHGESCNDLIRRILLTASGGPFFGWSRDKLSGVTPAQALAHPTWKMGKKITVDCASLMNKGFEVIEAVRLFGIPVEKVEVLVHRQSIIHSMVEYIDNSVIAQLGEPDMRTCIRYAVTHPARAFTEGAGLDFTSVGKLTFDKPDSEAFPLLNCARNSIKRGGIVPTALIAADEEAVDAFIQEKISFTDMFGVVEETLLNTQTTEANDIRDYYEAEEDARIKARQIIERFACRHA